MIMWSSVCRQTQKQQKYKQPCTFSQKTGLQSKQLGKQMQRSESKNGGCSYRSCRANMPLLKLS